MRTLIASLVLTLAFLSDASAQTGSGFTVDSRPMVVLVGCDAVGPGDPEVDFAQMPDGLFGFIGQNDFEGEDCAEVLTELLDRGFEIMNSRTVRQSTGREIIVYDLLAQ